MKSRTTAELYSLLLLLTISILAGACSSTQTKEDGELTQRLLGNWIDEKRESISFYAEGKFVDTLFIELPHVPDAYIPEFIFEGTFTVTNRELLFKDVKVNYSKAAETSPEISFHKTVSNRTISFVDDELFLQEIQKYFSENEFIKSPNGKWKADNAVVIYSSAKQNFEFAKAVYEYDFKSENNSCRRKIKFDADYSEPEINSGFSYESNRLNFTAMPRVMAVFKEDHWLWFMRDPARFTKR